MSVRPDTQPSSKTARSPLNGAEIPLGAHPANTGGKKGCSGRPPSAIREQCRGSFAERVSVLEAIVDDPNSNPTDRIRAMDLLRKYGLGSTGHRQVDKVNRVVFKVVREDRRQLGQA